MYRMFYFQGKTQDVGMLLGKFKTAQARHVQRRREAVRRKSLQNGADASAAGTGAAASVNVGSSAPSEK